RSLKGDVSHALVLSQSEYVTSPAASIVAHARSPRQHCILTATGSWLMCVCAHSMLTANAVVTPPSPCGPMPVWLIRWSSSVSSWATSGSGLWVPTLRKQLASLAIAAARSLVPPRPMPTMVGGHGLAPESKTHSRTNFLTALTPSAGLSIRRKLMFSDPDPFGAIHISIVSESGTKSNLTTGIPWPVLVWVFLRVSGWTELDRSG